MNSLYQLRLVAIYDNNDVRFVGNYGTVNRPAWDAAYADRDKLQALNYRKLNEIRYAVRWF